MLLQPPPKFFEDINDVKFDRIRYHRWFVRYQKRQAFVKQVKGVYVNIGLGLVSQKKVAAITKMDIKYLRYYRYWLNGISRFDKAPDKNAYQKVLDDSYDIYCQHGGKTQLSSIAIKMIPLYGLSAMRFYRYWEFDRNFIPTQLKT